MGEAAYREAEKNGELLHQRLQVFAERLSGDDEALVAEAINLVMWLSRERDSLIAELERTSTENSAINEFLDYFEEYGMDLCWDDKATVKLRLVFRPDGVDDWNIERHKLKRPVSGRQK